MSLTRLKRQDLHTCICTSILILINSCAFYLVNKSIPFTVIFAVIYTVSGVLTGTYSVGIRVTDDLFLRHLFSGTITLVIMTLFTQDVLQMVLLFLLINAIYGIWLAGAGKWMRHEICPGWTLLLYDSRENLEQAKAIVESRKDLMIDAYHCAYGGTEVQDCRSGRTKAVSCESDVDHIIRMFRIPQMVICLDAGREEVLDYCKSAGITAFVKGKKIRNGQKIDKEGLFYIRPVPAMRGYVPAKAENGVMSR